MHNSLFRPTCSRLQRLRKDPAAVSADVALAERTQALLRQAHTFGAHPMPQLVSALRSWTAGALAGTAPDAAAAATVVRRLRHPYGQVSLAQLHHRQQPCVKAHHLKH